MNRNTYSSNVDFGQLYWEHLWSPRQSVKKVLSHHSQLLLVQDSLLWSNIGRAYLAHDTLCHRIDRWPGEWVTISPIKTFHSALDHSENLRRNTRRRAQGWSAPARWMSRRVSWSPLSRRHAPPSRRWRQCHAMSWVTRDVDYDSPSCSGSDRCRPV